MVQRKVNDNGPLPGHPNPDVPMTADRAVREAAEDMDYEASEAAKREGLNCSYTKAPWLVRGAK